MLVVVGGGGDVSLKKKSLRSAPIQNLRPAYKTVCPVFVCVNRISMIIIISHFYFHFNIKCTEIAARGPTHILEHYVLCAVALHLTCAH